MIGELLRKIRGKDSLREASKKTGLSHNYISVLEKGVDPRSGSPIKPSPESLRAYEKGYFYPYEELMIAAGYLVEEGRVEDNRSPVEKLIEYLELELTDDEIIQRMTFKVDKLTLSDDEVREFIAFIRAKRAMRKPEQVAPSRVEES